MNQRNLNFCFSFKKFFVSQKKKKKKKKKKKIESWKLEIGKAHFQKNHWNYSQII